MVIGLFQKKSTSPWWKAWWKISREGGLTALEIQAWGGGEGGLNLQILPRGLLSSIFRSLRSLSVDDFEVLLCVFKLSYSFNLQTSYHIYFEFPSMDSITRVKEDQYWRYWREIPRQHSSVQERKKCLELFKCGVQAEDTCQPRSQGSLLPVLRSEKERDW